MNELPDADLTPPVPDGCDQKSIHDAPGVFADSSGSEGAECGTEQMPCASLQSALDHAGPDARVLYVGMGEYRENVAVPQALLARGFRIEGRWRRDVSGQWLPFCVPEADSAVLIGGRDDPATLRADLPDPDADAGTPEATDAGLPGSAELVLSSIVLRGAETVPGRSSYALYAANVAVELRASNVLAGRGGEGATGAPGPAGVGADGCMDGSVGAAGEAAPYGLLTRAGWSDPTALPATPAAVGNDGVCTVVARFECHNGGKGGVPGGTGHVGGASVAVYAWGSQLRLTEGSSLHTSGGGVGGNGGPGGEGAEGKQNLCSTNAKGGKGGTGGQGSPGAGGPSHCVVLLEGSALQGGLPVDRCSLGAPGLGGDNNKGLSGASSPVLAP